MRVSGVYLAFGALDPGGMRGEGEGKIGRYFGNDLFYTLS